MQISKSLLVLSVALLGILPQSVRAADTEAQIKAREALRQKLNELQPQSGNEVTPAAPTPAPVPAPSPRRPQAQVAKPMTPPMATPAPADSEAVARSRDALRKKMQELEGQSVPEKAPMVAPPIVAPSPPSSRPAAPPPVVVMPRRPVRPAPTPVPAIAPEAPKPARASGPTYSDVPPPKSPAPTPSAPVITTPTPAVPTPAPSSPPVANITTPQTPSATASERLEAEKAAQKQTFKPRAETKSKKTMKASEAFQPLAGPPLGISAEKKQRLDELLRRYQADEVTPAQYHEERAKILAAP